MATRGTIRVRGWTDKGLCIVESLNHATTGLLNEAMGQDQELAVRAEWPRRRGGRPYPALRLGPFDSGRSGGVPKGHMDD